MNKAAVSVVVCTYNHKAYIKECLESVLQQKTSFEFEIILGDDQSTDGTTQICQNYTQKHPDIIKLFIRDQSDVIFIDGQPTGRYNFIENLKAASGKFIALLDGDDYWTDPSKLQQQFDFMEASPAYSGCFHNTDFIDQPSPPAAIAAKKQIPISSISFSISSVRHRHRVV